VSDNLFVNLALASIVIHEMNAVRCKEWRIFPGLSLLNDRSGFIVFLLAHIPIFGLLFNALISGHNVSSLIIYLEIFFIIHFFLHLLFLRNPKNEFKDWISWTFITALQS